MLVDGFVENCTLNNEPIYAGDWTPIDENEPDFDLTFFATKRTCDKLGLRFGDE